MMSMVGGKASTPHTGPGLTRVTATAFDMEPSISAPAQDMATGAEIASGATIIPGGNSETRGITERDTGMDIVKGIGKAMKHADSPTIVIGDETISTFDISD
jgi:hypothetical protein